MFGKYRVRWSLHYAKIRHWNGFGFTIKLTTVVLCSSYLPRPNPEGTSEAWVLTICVFVCVCFQISLIINFMSFLCNFWHFRQQIQGRKQCSHWFKLNLIRRLVTLLCKWGANNYQIWFSWGQDEWFYRNKTSRAYVVIQNCNLFCRRE